MAPIHRIALLSFIVAVTSLSCSETSQKAESESWKARQERAAKVLARLASEHAASSDWDRGLGFARFEPVYSVDVQEALVSGNAIAFLATLTDVEKREDQYRIVLSYPPVLPTSIIFYLGASARQVDSVLSIQRELFAEYAVVARIETVDRLALTLYPDDSGESPNMEADSIDLPFRASGTCMALERIAAEGT